MQSTELEIQEMTGLEGRYSRVEPGVLMNTYEVDIGGERFFVQYSEELETDFRRGAHVLEELDNTEIPTPEVVEFDRGNQPYLVTRAVRGEPVIDSPADEQLFEAGRVLADLHRRFDFDRAGLVDTGQGLNPENGKTWKDYLNLLISKKVNHSRELIDPELDYMILDAFRENEDLLAERDEYALLNADYRGENLIFDGFQLNGIVDWDMSIIGDPYYEVVKAAKGFEREFGRSDSFIEGYRSEKEYDIDPDLEKVYLAVAELGNLSSLNFRISKREEKITADQVNQSVEFLENTLQELL